MDFTPKQKAALAASNNPEHKAAMEKEFLSNRKMLSKKSSKTKSKKKKATKGGGFTAPQKEFVSVTRGFVASKPKYNFNGRNLTVSHREYVGRVSNCSNDWVYLLDEALNWNVIPKLNPFASGTNALIKPNAINPENRRIFEPLNGIAQNFEFFKIDKMNFHYEPGCGSNLGGQIIVAWDADILDNPPSSHTAMLQFGHAASNVVHKPLDLSVPPSKKLFMDELRHSAIGQGQNIASAESRLSDYGAIYVACSGVPTDPAGASVRTYLGDFFVDYEITFYEWQPKPELLIASTRVRTISPGLGTATAMKPFGDSVVVSNHQTGVHTGSYNSTIAGGNIQAVIFDEPGDYELVLYQEGTGFNSPTWTLLGANSSTNNENLDNGIGATIQTFVSTATQTGYRLLVKLVTAPAAVGLFYNALSTLVQSDLTVGRLFPGTIYDNSGLISWPANGNNQGYEILITPDKDAKGANILKNVPRPVPVATSKTVEFKIL